MKKILFVFITLLSVEAIASKEIERKIQSLCEEQDCKGVAIGYVEEIRGVARASGQELKEDSVVVLNDRIEVEPEGHVLIRFIDETTLEARGHTDILLDPYVYELKRSIPDRVFNLIEGVLRLLSPPPEKDLEAGLAGGGIRG